jgi:secreted PhoX family phosphatase
MGHHPVEDLNRSGNLSLESIIDGRLSRRTVLKGGAAAATLVAGANLVGCGGSSSGGSSGDADGITVAPKSLGFSPVPHSLTDQVIVPDGYEAKVLIAKGDPLAAGVSAFSNNGTDNDYDKRSGDQHDGMWFFGMNSQGEYDPAESNRGLLVTNHEQLLDSYVHASAGDVFSGSARSKQIIDREIHSHGVSVVEVRKENGEWVYVQDSAFNRRITGDTEMTLEGPVKRMSAVKTVNSPDGTKAFGTLNNCASGYTPWGTYLTCEENWYAYFARDEDGPRDARDIAQLDRMGIGAMWSYRGWDQVTDSSSTLYSRFNIDPSEASAEEDSRNEANTHGYIVEINPFDPASTPKKRSAMGRFSHEGAWFAPAVEGKPLVYYMGDDARGEYLYKFVSEAGWDPADATNPDAGDKYLDQGTLYVAKFNNDGTGEWIALTYLQNGLDATNSDYAFYSQGDVILATRIAADSVGATPMDRPEWTTVNPLNGEVYLTLTNNRVSAGRAIDETDGANPRTYEASGSDGRDGNANGHIIRWREDNNDHGATEFQWDIFLFGAPSTQSSDVNVSALTADNDFSSPDGLLIDARGVMWIQTDDGAYRDTTNNQMLVAIPGEVGDGGSVIINNQYTDSGGVKTGSQLTYVGKDAAGVDLRRFLVGPNSCEITGITLTPDFRTMFVNIQHPGEDDDSSWPNSSGVATDLGDGSSRPRSATIVITRTDGGELGV